MTCSQPLPAPWSAVLAIRQQCGRVKRRRRRRRGRARPPAVRPAAHLTQQIETQSRGRRLTRICDSCKGTTREGAARNCRATRLGRRKSRQRRSPNRRCDRRARHNVRRTWPRRHLTAPNARASPFSNRTHRTRPQRGVRVQRIRGSGRDRMRGTARHSAEGICAAPGRAARSR